MNTHLNSSNRKGFIIVISLTLMLVMMTMGIGLYYSSKQSAELVGSSVTKSDGFYAAATCIAEARVWLKLESAVRPPCKNKAAGTVCYEILQTKMSKWQLSSESQTFKNRAQTQLYQCKVSLLGKVAYEGGEGVGFNVGEGRGYDAQATQTKYLYRIRAEGYLKGTTPINGVMPMLFKSEVEVIDSMIF